MINSEFHWSTRGDLRKFVGQVDTENKFDGLFFPKKKWRRHVDLKHSWIFSVKLDHSFQLQLILYFSSLFLCHDEEWKRNRFQYFIEFYLLLKDLEMICHGGVSSLELNDWWLDLYLPVIWSLMYFKVLSPHHQFILTV